MEALYKDMHLEQLVKLINKNKYQKIKNHKTVLDQDNLALFLTFAQRFSNKTGGRNDNFMKICREGLALAIPHDLIMKEALRFIYGDFTQKEAETTLNKQIEYHNKDNFKSFSKLEIPEGNKNLEVAHQIIEKSKDVKSGFKTLATLDGLLHEYDDGVYKKVNEKIHMLQLRKQLNSIPSFKATENKIQEVYKNIKSETLIKSDKTNNFFIEYESENIFIALRSSVLDLTEALRNKIIQYLLTPQFFCTGKLSFDYDPNAKCPTFLSVLERILKDSEDQKQLQCWFAYHLLNNTKYGKFMIFIGDGANGKSVILKILRILLGEQNVSSVPIERLSNKDRFSAVETYGKMANISDEMSGDSIDEAFIKNYVTGGRIMVEKKYDHPFEFQPTAKLTFSTNTFPKIKDTSEGFWRRLLIIEFKEKILPEEQRPEFLDDKFWTDSGELSGIFNWVLEGVRYINDNNRLFESKNSAVLTQQKKLSSNTVKQWIKDNLNFKEGSFLDRSNAYDFYKVEQLAQGEKPNTATEFYKEIEKEFPQAIHQKNPIMHEGSKRRGFHNIRMGTVDTGDL